MLSSNKPIVLDREAGLLNKALAAVGKCSVSATARNTGSQFHSSRSRRVGSISFYFIEWNLLIVHVIATYAARRLGAITHTNPYWRNLHMFNYMKLIALFASLTMACDDDDGNTQDTADATQANGNVPSIVKL